MALINCPECGKQISDKAKRCPNCGVRLKKKRIFIPIIIICCVVFGVLIYFGANYIITHNMSNEKLIDRNIFNKTISSKIDENTTNDIHQILVKTNTLVSDLDVTKEQSIDVIDSKMLDLCNNMQNNRYIKKYIDEQSTDKKDEEKYKCVEPIYNLTESILTLIDGSEIHYPEIDPYTTEETLNDPEVQWIFPYIEDYINQIKSAKEDREYGDASDYVAKKLEEELREMCNNNNIVLDENFHIVTEEDVDLTDTETTISFDKNLWNDVCKNFQEAVNYYYK